MGLLKRKKMLCIIVPGKEEGENKRSECVSNFIYDNE